jgi:hypothetical protein
VAIIGTFEVFEMQYQPNFETWIRSSNSNSSVATNFNRFFKSGVFIPVEYRPDFVVFFV